MRMILIAGTAMLLAGSSAANNGEQFERSGAFEVAQYLQYRHCDNLDGLSYIVPAAAIGQYQRCTNAFPALQEAIGMACFSVSNFGSSRWPQYGTAPGRHGINFTC